MQKKYFILIVIGIILTSFLINPTNQIKKEIKITLKEKTIFAQIANSPQERTEGLMFKKSLCENCGMLFVFDKELKHKFWMKNTLIPLDIIYINKNLEVVDLIPAKPCKRDPCKSYEPKEKAIYVLEVEQGSFGQSIIGEKLKFLE